MRELVLIYDPSTRLLKTKEDGDDYAGTTIDNLSTRLVIEGLPEGIPARLDFKVQARDSTGKVIYPFLVVEEGHVDLTIEVLSACRRDWKLPLQLVLQDGEVVIASRNILILDVSPSINAIGTAAESYEPLLSSSHVDVRWEGLLLTFATAIGGTQTVTIPWDKLSGNPMTNESLAVLVNSINANLDALYGAYVPIGRIAQSNPSQEDLTARAIELRGEPVSTGWVLLDNDGIEWYLFEGMWDNIGQYIIGLATSEIAGIAKLHDELNDKIDGGVTPRAVKAAITAHESRISDAEHDIESLDARTTSAEGKIDGLRSDVDGHTDQIRATSESVQILDVKTLTNETNIDDLKGRMGIAESDINSLEGRAGTSEGDIASLKGRTTTAEGKITSLETRVKGTEDDITEITADMIGMASDIATKAPMSALANYQLRSEKGVENGYTPLGGDARTPKNYLPSDILYSAAIGSTIAGLTGGIVPKVNLPADLLYSAMIGAAGGIAPLDLQGLLSSSRLHRGSSTGDVVVLGEQAVTGEFLFWDASYGGTGAFRTRAITIGQFRGSFQYFSQLPATANSGDTAFVQNDTPPNMAGMYGFNAGLVPPRWEWMYGSVDLTPYQLVENLDIAIPATPSDSRYPSTRLLSTVKTGLEALIAAKAASSTVTALTTRVTTAEGNITGLRTDLDGHMNDSGKHLTPAEKANITTLREPAQAQIDGKVAIDQGTGNNNRLLRVVGGVVIAQAPVTTVGNNSNIPLNSAVYNALIPKANSVDLIAHMDDKANPHSVNKSQVGLGNVDNTTDMNKPVSTAQATAINARVLIAQGSGAARKVARGAASTGNIEMESLASALGNNDLLVPNSLIYGHTSDTGVHVTADEKSKIANAVLVTGNQDISGEKNFNNIIRMRFAGSDAAITGFRMDKSAIPANITENNTFLSLVSRDKDSKDCGWFRNYVYTGYTMSEIYARRYNDDGTTKGNASLSIRSSDNGEMFGSAPTPPESHNTTSIATTAWARNAPRNVPNVAATKTFADCVDDVGIEREKTFWINHLQADSPFGTLLSGGRPIQVMIRNGNTAGFAVATIAAESLTHTNGGMTAIRNRSGSVWGPWRLANDAIFEYGAIYSSGTTYDPDALEGIITGLDRIIRSDFTVICHAGNTKMGDANVAIPRANNNIMVAIHVTRRSVTQMLLRARMYNGSVGYAKETIRLYNSASDKGTWRVVAVSSSELAADQFVRTDGNRDLMTNPTVNIPIEQLYSTETLDVVYAALPNASHVYRAFRNDTLGTPFENVPGSRTVLAYISKYSDTVGRAILHCYSATADVTKGDTRENILSGGVWLGWTKPNQVMFYYPAVYSSGTTYDPDYIYTVLKSAKYSTQSQFSFIISNGNIQSIFDDATLGNYVNVHVMRRTANEMSIIASVNTGNERASKFKTGYFNGTTIQWSHIPTFDKPTKSKALVIGSNGHAKTANTTEAEINNLTGLNKNIMTAFGEKQDANITADNVTSVSWTADTSIPGFSYRGQIAIPGATTVMTPMVFFSQADVVSGRFSTYCETYAGGVYIWSKTNASVSIPRILVVK